MEAHTQGNWRRAPGDSRLIIADMGVDSFGAPIRRAVASITPHRDLDEATMNGRLICAAPTMREYIERKANKGDEEARRILEGIDA